MILKPFLPLNAREQGVAFDGLANPATGKSHFASLVPQEDRFLPLKTIARRYVTREYGIHGPLRMQKNGSYMPNSADELRTFLEEAASKLPSAKNRVQFFDLSFFDEFGIERSGKEKIPRLVVLPEGDRHKIPKEFWGSFYYIFVDSNDELNPVLVKMMESRVEGILEVARLNSRCIAAGGKNGSLCAYEMIIGNAIHDSGLGLEPMLSLSPNEIHALMLKTYIYLFLAKPGANPDFVAGAIRALDETDPFNYYKTGGKQAFLTKENGSTDGFAQLLYDASMMCMENTARTMQGATTFKAAQIGVDALQFIEDAALLLRNFGSFVYGLVSHGGGMFNFKTG